MFLLTNTAKKKSNTKIFSNSTQGLHPTAATKTEACGLKRSRAALKNQNYLGVRMTAIIVVLALK